MIVSRLTAAVADLAGGVADLVVPGSCAGCGAERVPLRVGVCAGCVAALEGLQPHAAVPVPPPPGLPACVTVGAYDAALRSVLLAYKEKGRHRLAGPLGALLAGAVTRVAAEAGGAVGVPLMVLPVPSTASAARARHGDHMARLAAHTAQRLRAAGWPTRVVQPMRALPRPDSAGLDTPGRIAAAENSLRIRSGRIRAIQRGVTMGGMLVVVDDILTTGATMSAVTRRLEEVDVQVTGGAVLAATRLRNVPGGASGGLPSRGADWANRPEWVPRTRGDGRASAG